MTTPAPDIVAPDKGLKRGALGLVSSVVVGLASTAPAYSLAATLGLVIAAGGTLLAGVKAPAIMLISFVPMYLIAVAYQELNPGRTEATVEFGRLVSKGYGVPAVETVPVRYRLKTSYAAVSLQAVEGIKEAHGYIHISGHQFFIFHIIHLTFGRHD